MGITSTPTGGHRAYKEIKGVEYQIYSTTLEQAKINQAKLDKKAKSMLALGSQVLFGADGRLKGSRVYIDERPSKTSTIKAYIQLPCQQGTRKQYKREKTHKGYSETLWQFLKQVWIEHYRLNGHDIKQHSGELKIAKQRFLEELEVSKVNYKKLK